MRKIVGIDTGVVTGLAVWDAENKRFSVLGSTTIHRALKLVEDIKPDFVRVEDARLRKDFGNTGRERLQGAGSVKRDAKIWEDFLLDNNFPFEMVPPVENKTKLSQVQFKRMTGWKNVTNEHSRDAGCLVYGLTPAQAKNLIKANTLKHNF